MATLPPELLIELCRRAAAEPIGLLVETPTVLETRQNIYTALFNEGLTTTDLGITVCVPDIPNCFFIVHKDLELD